MKYNDMDAEAIYLISQLSDAQLEDFIAKFGPLVDAQQEGNE